MTDSTLSVLRSVLSPHTVAQHIAKLYRIGDVVACQLLAHSHDDLYRIQTNTGQYVLRIYAAGTDRAHLEAQAHILEVMSDAHVPAVQPIQSDVGYVVDFSAPEGLRHAMLYAHVAGVAAGRDITAPHAHAYGQLVARLHNVADRCQLTAPLTIDLDFLIDEPFRIIQPVIEQRPHARAVFEHVAAQLKNAINHCAATTQPVAFGLCHGDVHKSNILVDSAGQLTLVDWDCAGMGWRAYDVAILRWSIGPAMGKEGIGEPRLSEVWSAYLDGYTHVRTLSADDLAAIPLFVAARHLRVLGWEVDRALNGIAGVGYLTDRYFDWWLETLEAWVTENLTGLKDL